jgi:hypothetical protein
VAATISAHTETTGSQRGVDRIEVGVGAHGAVARH